MAGRKCNQGSWYQWYVLTEGGCGRTALGGRAPRVFVCWEHAACAPMKGHGCACMRRGDLQGSCQHAFRRRGEWQSLHGFRALRVHACKCVRGMPGQIDASRCEGSWVRPCVVAIPGSATLLSGLREVVDIARYSASACGVVRRVVCVGGCTGVSMWLRAAACAAGLLS